MVARSSKRFGILGHIPPLAHSLLPHDRGSEAQGKRLDDSPISSMVAYANLHSSGTKFERMPTFRSEQPLGLVTRGNPEQVCSCYRCLSLNHLVRFWMNMLRCKSCYNYGHKSFHCLSHKRKKFFSWKKKISTLVRPPNPSLLKTTISETCNRPTISSTS